MPIQPLGSTNIIDRVMSEIDSRPQRQENKTENFPDQKKNHNARNLLLILSEQNEVLSNEPWGKNHDQNKAMGYLDRYKRYQSSHRLFFVRSHHGFEVFGNDVHSSARRIGQPSTRREKGEEVFERPRNVNPTEILATLQSK